ncbi:MAG: M28 family peptidase [Acidobacteriia bacterium]|nr:M28 family peptidase [Terriglobia bacterium]
MRRLSAIALALMMALPAMAQVTYSATVASMIGQVSQTALTSDLNGLTGVTAITVGGSSYTITSRATDSGTPITKATQWMYERCQAAGLTASYQNWSDRGYSSRNVICTKAGTTKATEIITLTAHIDATPPGADDNASGSVLVINLAEIMASHTFERTLRYILVTGEEQAELGSTAYVASLGSDNIYADINFDVVAYDANADNKFSVITGGGLSEHTGTATEIAIATLVGNVVSTYSLGLTEVSGDIMVTPGALDTWPFWNAGKTAVSFLEDVNELSPYMNGSGDSVSTLNLPYYTKVVKTALGTAAHLALPADAATNRNTISGSVRIGGGVTMQ